MQYNLIYNITQYLCIIVACILFYDVRRKKKEITNSLRNTSYSLISIWIMNLVAGNMIVFAVFSFVAKFSNCIEDDCYFIYHLNQFSFLYGAFTRIISFTQMYEWLSMRAIIIWQSSKDLTEALYSLNDENNLCNYQKIEDKIEKLWILCSMIAFSICLASAYTFS